MSADYTFHTSILYPFFSSSFRPPRTIHAQGLDYSNPCLFSFCQSWSRSSQGLNHSYSHSFLSRFYFPPPVSHQPQLLQLNHIHTHPHTSLPPSTHIPT